MLLEQVLLSDRDPDGQTSGSLIGSSLTELEILNLGDIGAPGPEANVWYGGQRWKGTELVVMPEVIFKFQRIGHQAVGRHGTAHSAVMDV